MIFLAINEYFIMANFALIYYTHLKKIMCEVDFIVSTLWLYIIQNVSKWCYIYFI